MKPTTSGCEVKGLVEGAADGWVNLRLTYRLPLPLGLVGVLFSIWQSAVIGEFAPQMLAGATFLAGAMVNALLRVWSWADATDAQVARLQGHVRIEQMDRNQLRARFDALERVQTIAALATVLAVTLMVALIVAIVNPPSLDASGRVVVPAVNTWATHLAIGLSVAVGVCLLAIVAETVHVGADALKANRTTVGAQSGPRG